MSWAPPPLATDDVDDLVVDNIGGDHTIALRVLHVRGPDLSVDVQGAWDTLAWAPNNGVPGDVIGELVVLLNWPLPEAAEPDSL